MAITNDWYIDYHNRLIIHATHILDYEGQSNNFRVGDTINGQTSGATAIIVNDADGGATGTLDLVYLSGTFQNGENIRVGTTTYAEAVVPTSGMVAKSTVYNSRQLYSFLQDTFDELVQMDDTVPMSAQTPTEFTLINGWFIDDDSTKYLSGGAISTSGYLNEIRVITFTATYTEAVVTDIGKTVTGGTTSHTGILLHYNNDTRKWWVRSAGASQFNQAETVSVTGGTGTGNTTGAAGTGEDLYANVYTLGTIQITPNPKTYIFQNEEALEEWWGRGNAEAHIDVLVKVKEANNLVDGGDITVFVRHFGDLFDHFGITLNQGGRNAVPLATQPDLNNDTTGEQILTVDSIAGFDEESFVRGGTSGAYGEILTVDVTNMALHIGNIVGAYEFVNETIYETTDGLPSGDTGTSAEVTNTTDVVAGFNNIKITFVNAEVDVTGSPTGTVNEGDVLTGAINGATAVFLGVKPGSPNTIILGNLDESSGALAANEQLQIDGSNFYTLAAALNRVNTHTMIKKFEQQQEDPLYSVIIDCAQRPMSQVYEWLKYVTREDANSTQKNYQTMYPLMQGTVNLQDGEEYIAARVHPDPIYNPVKASPFGTFAGGKLFGAQGVWVQNMADSDRQNFQLIDASGNTRTPPNFITITVNSVVAGDKVTVFRTTSGTEINKAQFTLDDNNNASDVVLVVNGSIPSDTPNSGNIRVVDTSDTSINRETRYSYISWEGSTFTLSGGNQLDRSYTGTEDTAYVPYFDEIAGDTSVSVIVIHSGTDQSVLTRVRRYNGSNDSILPFQISGNVTSSGYTVAAIRTADTIVQ